MTLLSAILLFPLFIASTAYAGDSNLLPVRFTKNYKPFTWVDLETVKFISENIFVHQIIVGTEEGALKLYEGKVDCESKKYSYAYEDANRPIVPGTAADIIGQLLCRKTPAAEGWGFTTETKHLWDAATPKSKPGFQKGKWIEAKNGSHYNDNIINNGGHITYAQYNNFDIKDPSVSAWNYQWVTVECGSNMASIYWDRSRAPDISSGFWMAPIPTSMDGTASLVRTNHCK